MPISEVNPSSFIVHSDRLLLKGHNEPCLVIFYIHDCSNCDMLFSVVENISKSVPNVSFLKVDMMASNRLLIAETKKTKWPITQVPTVFFYVKGVPTYNYKGGYSETGVMKFIKTMFDMMEPISVPGATNPIEYSTNSSKERLLSTKEISKPFDLHNDEFEMQGHNSLRGTSYDFLSEAYEGV